MNINKVLKIQVLAILFVIVVGTLSHFTYALSGNSNFVALFSAINESTWEHLKLIFFPTMLFSIIQYFFLKNDVKNFWQAKTIGAITGMFMIVVIFYTYTGIIGDSLWPIDILLFVISAITSEYIAYRIMIKEEKRNKITQALSIACVILITIMFFAYTFNPPEIPLFLDPITKSYGI